MGGMKGAGRGKRKNTGLKSRHRPAEAKRLTDHVADRVCRIADALIRLSARSIKQQWGIRHTDLRLLNILDGGEAIPVRELSRRAYVDQAWVSRSLRELELKDLVERRSDPRDSRLSLVNLTDHGRAILDEIRPYTLKSEQFLLAGIDAKTLKSQLDVLEKNTAALLDAVKARLRV